MTILANIHNVSDQNISVAEHTTKLLCPFDGSFNDISDFFVEPVLIGGTTPTISNAQLKIIDSSYAASFTGTNNEYIDYGDLEQYEMRTKDFCIDFWMYAPAQPNNPCGVASKISGGFVGWLVQINGGFVRLYASGGVIDISDPVAHSINTWVHYALNRQRVAAASTRVSIFRDGKRVVTGLTGAVADIDAPGGVAMEIGRQGGWAARTFSGYIQNFRLRVGHHGWTNNFHPPDRYYRRKTEGTKLLIHSHNQPNNSLHIMDSSCQGNAGAGHIINRLAATVEHSTAQAVFDISSVYFNGTGAMDFPDSNDWDFGSGDFTIEAWVYDISLVGQTIIFEHYLAPNGWAFYLNAGNLRFWDSVNGVVLNTPGIVINTWHHVVVCKVGAFISLYIDGTYLAGTAAPGATGTPAGARNLDFGSRQNASQWFTGYIDQARIIKGQGVYPSGVNFTIPNTSFIEVNTNGNDTNTELLIQSNTTNGSTVFDDNSISPTNHTIVANGTAIHSTAIASPLNQSSVIDFNTGAGYLSCGHHVNFALLENEWCVDFWIYPTVVAGNWAVIEQLTGGISPGWTIWQQNTNLIFLSGGANRLTGTNILTLNNWHHIALTLFRGQLQFWRDGTIFTPKAPITLIAESNGADQLNIGSRSGGAPFTGYMAEVRLSRNVRRFIYEGAAPVRPYY